MNNSIQQIAALIKSGGNPEQLMLNYLQQNSNPITQNLLKLAQSGDGAGIEQIARNMCKSKGLDFDKEFTAFKQSLGL